MERAKVWKAEIFLFVLFVLITAFPVLAHPYFPTVDGPAHLHNANLLKQYWFLNQQQILDFFDFNKHLNSNFADHVWFALAGLFLPAFLVEKSILLFYVIALPFSFRYLVKAVAGNTNSARIAAYLIFPFVYSFTFRIGFFNFCIGIPVLFWTIGYWINHRDRMSTRKIIWMSVLSTLVYVSHIFNFMLLGIIIISNEIQYLVHSGTMKGIVSRLKHPFLVFLSGAILAVLFVASNNSYEHSPPTYLSFGKLTETLTDLSPVITLSYEKEILYARILGASLLLLLIFAGIDFFRNRRAAAPEFRPRWIFALLIVLLLFYIFPDWMASGGFISIRWALFFFLVMIILIAAKNLHPKFLALPVCIILLNHLFFISYHNNETAILSDDAKTLVAAEEYMEENTLLLPLNYSANWMHINHANYMATQKNIINLDNYEPTKPHFPLIWKKGEQVYDLMPGYGNRYPPCINIGKYETATHHRIDYLSRFCFDGNVNDSCTALVEKEIQNKFDLIYQSPDKKMLLYKRRPNT